MVPLREVDLPVENSWLLISDIHSHLSSPFKRESKLFLVFFLCYLVVLVYFSGVEECRKILERKRVNSDRKRACNGH